MTGSTPRRCLRSAARSDRRRIGAWRPLQEPQEKFAERPVQKRQGDSGADRGKTGQGGHGPPFSRSALDQHRLQQ